MCHLLLSKIQQESADKFKIRKPDGLICEDCTDFHEDEAFSIIGMCSKKNVYVSRFQQCTLLR